MNSLFQRIGILTRPNTATQSMKDVIQFLRTHHLAVYLDRKHLAEELNEFCVDKHCHIVADLGNNCDLILVLGGDGAFLSAAHQAAPFNVPLVGINQGHLGFLTQITQENMFTELVNILEGKYRKDECVVLETKVSRDSEVIYQGLALNDVVLSRGGAGQLIEFEVFINDEFVYSQRSDGLIVSTPTGSTAYSLAAGGPILQNVLHAFALVPICPQSMTNRPIVIGDDNEIKILITKAGDARVHYDGQSFVDIQTMDVISINRYHNMVHIYHPSSYQYYKTLRQKLHWGEQLV